MRRVSSVEALTTSRAFTHTGENPGANLLQLDLFLIIQRINTLCAKEKNQDIPHVIRSIRLL